MPSLISKKEAMSKIYDIFKADPEFVLLAGDMGFAVLDSFFDNHPNRAFNTGINEQATMSIAAGMAITGMRPIIYSQIPFITMRAFEQLRYDINEHKLNVKIVGVGASNYFSALGRSHCMDDDDIALVSVLKNIEIYSPTSETLEKDIEAMFSHNGPSYMRTL
ncbi:transketolase [Pseudoalteromonas rubra]|uniref:Transketolase n=1 Tax=Pseudoalteromonas rubra TaxID=43658 RepID=A0A5S3WJ70_9GAMM|nr:transketolase [Pseudoalteromonas rubra]TMP27113.1 transketolase [Pseudoalteromonas rubra]TMP36122.1 transketolase [Pseudoalteromonas rubra]